MKIIGTHNYSPKTSKFRYKNFNMLASNYKQKQKWFCCHQQPKWIQIKLLKSQWIVARNINLLALFWILFICMREIIDYAVAYRAWHVNGISVPQKWFLCNAHSKLQCALETFKYHHWWSDKWSLCNILSRWYDFWSVVMVSFLSLVLLHSLYASIRNFSKISGTFSMNISNSIWIEQCNLC